MDGQLRGLTGMGLAALAAKMNGDLIMVKVVAELRKMEGIGRGDGWAWKQLLACTRLARGWE